MPQVNSNQNTTFTSRLNVKPESIKRNFFRELPPPARAMEQEIQKEKRTFLFTSPLRVKLLGQSRDYLLNEVSKKREESKSAVLLEYMKRKGQYLLSKMKEDWQKAINYKFIPEPETSEVDVILRFLFGR